MTWIIEHLEIPIFISLENLVTNLKCNFAEARETIKINLTQKKIPQEKYVVMTTKLVRYPRN
jgi:hypothetical protein